jgi:hypothetical protein
MTRNRTSLRAQDSNPGSPGASSEEEDDESNKSPITLKTPARGRKESRAGADIEETTK